MLSCWMIFNITSRSILSKTILFQLWNNIYSYSKYTHHDSVIGKFGVSWIMLSIIKIGNAYDLDYCIIIILLLFFWRKDLSQRLMPFTHADPLSLMKNLCLMLCKLILWQDILLKEPVSFANSLGLIWQNNMFVGWFYVRPWYFSFWIYVFGQQTTQT